MAGEEHTARIRRNPGLLVSLIGLAGAVLMIGVSAASGGHLTVGLWVLIGGMFSVTAYIEWVTEDG